jgi:two-component system response regulator AtoC
VLPHLYLGAAVVQQARCRIEPAPREDNISATQTEGAAPAALRILLIDDEPEILATVGALLRRLGYDVATAVDGSEGLARFDREGADIIVSDVMMPGVDGLGLLRGLRERGADVEVILITGVGTMDTAVEALREGAFDFFTKPVRIAELTAALERTRRYQQLRRERDRLQSRLDSLDGGLGAIVGSSPAMAGVMELVDRVAQAERTTVLVTGESGTGKELVARAIHDRSRRAGQPFISLNCTAVPDALFESELFGHEKGAFTDADARKPGMFELGEGGTLFLDEIADMSGASQGKILRVLEERRLRRVGGVREIPVDVRLVAATNRDLEGMQRDGDFRQDLYFRLKVFTVHLPPLRERGDDVLHLAEHFLAQYADEFRKDVVGLDDDARQLLLGYAFPGNVRELRNLIERAVILADGDRLTPAEFADLAEPTAAAPSPATSLDLAQLEESAIRAAFERAGGNQGQTARLLGIGVDALRYRLRKYGLR